MGRGAAAKGGPAVAFVAMPERGHFSRMVPLIAGLAEAGLRCEVFTDARFRAQVERAGGRFVDLFGRYPLEAADSRSSPVACRFVTYAGRYGARLAADLERLDPAAVVYDTFSVIGLVAGRELGVPHINVCCGHAVEPLRFLELLADDPRVSIAPECERAVETLRERHGLADASPFSFVTGLSPHLNVYCEPAEYLTPEQRRTFEPIAFFGSLPSSPPAETGGPDATARFGPGDGPLIYASFGTVVWRYWPERAIETLRSVARAISSIPGAHGLISLGGTDPGPEAVASLEVPGVRVESFVDQWRALEQADLFVSHHGLNSTHEAIYHRVPLVSYPFFWDQPSLAALCGRLGFARPLGAGARARVGEEQAGRAIEAALASRGSMIEAVEAAREWELRTIAGRGAVLDRIAAIAA